MTKQVLNSAKEVKRKLPHEPVKIAYLFLLIAYGFVTVLTPNLNTFDSNGPKFLSLALLNLVAFIFLFTRKEVKMNHKLYTVFFRNDIGIAFVGLMVVSLLSFFKAINEVMFVLQFVKGFTVFSAVYLVAVLVLIDKRNILYLSIVMTLLLITDSITVFSEINRFIKGRLTDVSLIISIYANKNILASAVFVKIPFALWLMIFNRKWFRYIGYIAVFMAFTATFFLSTRAFYLGTFALTLILSAFFIIRYIYTHDKDFIKLAGILLTLFVVALAIFSFTQKYLYPQTDLEYAKSIGDRLSSVTDATGGNRIDAWINSWYVFKQNPILGVGLGNWMVATVKVDNLTNPTYLYKLNAHNDFVEIATETGIFGALFFISIFLLTGWALFKVLNKPNSSESIKQLFLPAFGLFCYSVDAFFNFPRDRPEIQILFVLYVGIAIAFTSLLMIENSKLSISGLIGLVIQRLPFISSKDQSFQAGRSNNSVLLSILLTVGLIMTVSDFILYQNFKSLKLQRIAKEDELRKKYKNPASLFINGFPAIPNINSLGEPIALVITRYLMNERRYNEAIELLKKDKSSPYLSSPEIFIADMYNTMKNTDSSLVYSLKAYKLKPYFFDNIRLLSNLLQRKGLHKEGEVIIDNYLNKVKDNKDAWIYASSFFSKSGNLQKAANVIDTAIQFFPDDSLIMKEKGAIVRKVMINKFKETYDKALTAFNSTRYDEAARLFSDLLINEPRLNDARVYRAYCYYTLKDYKKSNLDLDLLIAVGETQSTLYNVYNLRGANYIFLGKVDEACKDFKISADTGNKDGLDNYAKHCQTGK